jgi:hypothetical protein
MAYSTIPKGSLYMNTILHSGTGSTTTVTGVGFQPDMTWWKSRNNAVNHALYDAVRGGSKLIRPNQTNAEETNAAVSAFTSDGVTLTGGDSFTNASGYTYASWNWKAGTGQGSSNTDGSINTTYTSVNTTAGFSISKYTGNSTTGATVGHGLGATPKMIIIKSLGVENWEVYHASLGNTQGIYLNETNAAFTTSARWNNTSPTNSVWTMGNTSAVNGSGIDYIAYCFAEKKGFSKFGRFTANGSTNNAFVYTGFKPSWVMMKCDSVTEGWSNWYMFDTTRNPTNMNTKELMANKNNVESDNGVDYAQIDMLSNGFKIRNGSAWGPMASGRTNIYMAFAENPFVATSGTSAVPVTAR